MAGDKYSKCIRTTDLIREIAHYTGKSIVAHNGELDTDCSMAYHIITKPISFDNPHSHKFPEMLCFIGSDTRDISDLGAEVEVTLGGETHFMNTAGVISIPSGVKHCPITVKNIRKPVVFLEISLTRIWKPGRRPRKNSDLVSKV